MAFEIGFTHLGLSFRTAWAHHFGLLGKLVIPAKSVNRLIQAGLTEKPPSIQSFTNTRPFPFSSAYIKLQPLSLITFQIPTYNIHLDLANIFPPFSQFSEREIEIERKRELFNGDEQDERGRQQQREASCC